jgi:hypothetical protein
MGVVMMASLLRVQARQFFHAAPIVAVLEDRGEPGHVTELRGKEAVS